MSGGNQLKSKMFAYMFVYIKNGIDEKYCYLVIYVHNKCYFYCAILFKII